MCDGWSFLIQLNIVVTKSTNDLTLKYSRIQVIQNKQLRGQLITFYCLSSFEIWPDKWGGGSDHVTEGLLYMTVSI